MDEDQKLSTTFALLVSPVVAISLLILLGVFVVIGMTLFGWDRGAVLPSMGRVEYARGLITYLFAVVTIGTAVVLVVSVLTHRGQSADNDKAFERGKEVLSLLLGIFGTIVGYYFGSEKSAIPELKLIAPVVSPAQVRAGNPAKATVTAAVLGGSAPYQHTIIVDGMVRLDAATVKDGGLIIYDLDTKNLKVGVLPVKVEVIDSAHHVVASEGRIEVGN